MRYSPYEEEYAAVPTMGAGELLDYFLLRVFETEEVWGLENAGNWLTTEMDGQAVVPLWPYKRYADEAAVLWPNHTSSTESLEHFLYDTLEKFIAQQVMICILPTATTAGCHISPAKLQSILVGMMDAGEYVLEG